MITMLHRDNSNDVMRKLSKKAKTICHYLSCNRNE